MKLFDEIPTGWRFFKADGSVEGRFNVWFVRDEEGRKHWLSLPDEAQSKVDLYVSAVSADYESAFVEAIALAKSAHQLPLIEQGS
jgi:hypothetical protein